MILSEIFVPGINFSKYVKFLTVTGDKINGLTLPEI